MDTPSHKGGVYLSGEFIEGVGHFLKKVARKSICSRGWVKRRTSKSYWR